MWQTSGPPVLHRIIIVKLLTQHVRQFLGTYQWQSALLVVGLQVNRDWFEMGCHLSPSLISIRLTACRTSIPRKRKGNHKQTNRLVAGAKASCVSRTFCTPALKRKYPECSVKFHIATLERIRCEVLTLSWSLHEIFSFLTRLTISIGLCPLQRIRERSQRTRRSS